MGIIFIRYLLYIVNPSSSTKNKFPEIPFFIISTIKFKFSLATLDIILSTKIPVESALYNKGKIIYLEEKSSLDFGFSFNNVIKGNYKFYLHQHITNMKNAKLILKITINDVLVYETNDFPNNEILSQFDNNDIPQDNFNMFMSDDEEDDLKNINNEINLKETYICDIKEEMFDNVKNIIKKDYKSKNTFDSAGSTESNSIQEKNKNNDKIFDEKIKKYKIRVSFTNQHLFWKAGWYLDGGKLVKEI